MVRLMILRTLCFVLEARETFSLAMMAMTVGAGASNAAGYSTTTAVLSGLASFSVASWSLSRRRKGAISFGMLSAYVCFACFLELALSNYFV